MGNSELLKVHMTPILYARLVEYCDERGLSMSEVARSAINVYLGPK